MANDVFANGREVSCKAASGKTICAFPDVCFTPPQTPATPPGVPIPYPNTAMASDTTSGSKKVKVSGKEVMLKNKSYFKKSMGDEAGCAPLKGVITHKNRGKVYFNMWSMDVKFEGENVVRHLDLTTHNHASQVGQTPPLPYQDGMMLSAESPICAQTHDALTTEADDLPDSMSRIHEDSVTRREQRLSDAYPGREPPAVTLAIGQVIGGSSNVQSIIPAHSRKTIGQAAKRKHYAEGIDSPDKSMAQGCKSEEKFKYDEDALHHRHAEAKIIETWFAKGAKGQLVLNVSRPVCPNCAALIRHVNCGSDGKQCNKIIICGNNQNSEAVDRLKC